MNIIRRGLCVAFVALCAMGADGQLAPSRAAMYSTDRRFMVTGMTAAENMMLAGELADMAREVERTVGLPLPMGLNEVITVTVAENNEGRAEISRFQGWDGERFFQRLLLPERVRLDREDLLESASWILLNRYGSTYTPRSKRLGMGGMVPDWIAVGVGQNVLPILKTRNRDWLARELAENNIIPLQEVIKLEFLPSGRWREKVYAAAAVDFLWPAGDAGWVTLFGAVAGGTVIDAAWLRLHTTALSGREGHPEQRWKEFLQRYVKAQSPVSWGDISMRQEEKLVQALTFRPHQLLPDLPPSVADLLHAKDLIQYVTQEWMPLLAATLSLQIQGLSIGTTPDFQRVVGGYTAYFERLTSPPTITPPRKWWQRAEKRPKDAMTEAALEVALNQLWNRAERQHQEFLQVQQQRRRYVDAFEPPESPLTEEMPEDSVPRTRLQQAVDAFDSTMP